MTSNDKRSPKRWILPIVALVATIGLAIALWNKLREDVTYNSKLSALQLDVLRDLKRINSHLTAVAYPILEAAGQLRSRLRTSDTTEITT